MTKELEQKAEQLLEIEQVKKLYDKLMDINKEKAIAPVFMLKEILIRFGSNQEFREIEKDYEGLLKDLPSIGEEKPKYNLQSPEELEQFKERVKAYTKQAEKLNNIIERSFDLALQLQRQGKLIITWPEGLEAEEVMTDLLVMANSPVHYGFRSALARGVFEDEERGWPAADISQSTFQGKAYFKEPVSITATDEELKALQESMREKVLGLGKHGDLCADIFDIITAKWLSKAKHEHDTVKIRADEFLLARGLRARLREGGKRGGFEEEQRKAIAEQIEYLDQAWVTVKEMEVIRETESGKRKKEKWREDKKALVIEGIFGQQRLDGSLTAYQWEVKPGGVFAPFLYGPGRQTALLSCKALQYDFYRQKWEKRIARYLAWLWRINRGNKKEALRAETLLEAASMKIDKNRPSRTRDRLHKALDQLKEDGVITDWKEDTDKNLTARRGWWRQWLESKITITAPKEIIQHYEQIEDNRQKQLKGKK